jgi:hypothetical protein
MAETKEESKSSEESVKLFVGQVPKHMTESELLAMFKEFALVDEVNIIKDKATRASRGYFFFFFSVSIQFNSLSSNLSFVPLPSLDSPLVNPNFRAFQVVASSFVPPEMKPIRRSMLAITRKRSQGFVFSIFMQFLLSVKLCLKLKVETDPFFVERVMIRECGNCFDVNGLFCFNGC